MEPMLAITSVSTSAVIVHFAIAFPFAAAIPFAYAYAIDFTFSCPADFSAAPSPLVLPSTFFDHSILCPPFAHLLLGRLAVVEWQHVVEQ